MPQQQMFEPGAILRIDLDEQWHCYGRMLARQSKIAFFDGRAGAAEADPADADLAEIVGRDVLFVLDVHEAAYESGRWRKIGMVSLETSPYPVPDQYLQSLGSDRYRIVDENFAVRPATAGEIVGLERVAAWSAEQVEERLRDHFAGRPDRAAERMRTGFGRLQPPPGTPPAIA